MAARKNKVTLLRRLIDLDVYETEINLIVVDKPEHVRRKIREIERKYSIKTDVEVPKACYGYSLVIEESVSIYYIILAAEELNEDTVSHEIYHMTEYISQDMSLASDESKEASAHINGYLNKKVRETLAEAGIEIE